MIGKCWLTGWNKFVWFSSGAKVGTSGSSSDGGGGEKRILRWRKSFYTSKLELEGRPNQTRKPSSQLVYPVDFPFYYKREKLWWWSGGGSGGDMMTMTTWLRVRLFSFPCKRIALYHNSITKKPKRQTKSKLIWDGGGGGDTMTIMMTHELF